MTENLTPDALRAMLAAALNGSDHWWVRREINKGGWPEWRLWESHDPTEDSSSGFGDVNNAAAADLIAAAPTAIAKLIAAGDALRRIANTGTQLGTSFELSNAQLKAVVELARAALAALEGTENG